MGRAHPPLGTHHLLGTHPLPDPNGLFPEIPMLGSSDSLDFRHHDYKSMRKVTPVTQEGGS